MERAKTILIVILAIGGFALGVMLQAATRHIATHHGLAVALADTLHQYKNKDSTNGAYISTLVGSNKDLREALAAQSKYNKAYLILIDSLKKDRHIQTAAIVQEEGKIKYIHQIDTIYKHVNFDDTVNTKWYDSRISLHNSQLAVDVKTRDELFYKNSYKDNKGLFTGRTLTTSFSSMNPDNTIVGISSVSTVVDKRKPRIGGLIGFGGVINKGPKFRPGPVIGVGLTF